MGVGQIAHPIRQVRLSDRYELDRGLVHLTGLQALVRVLLDRHRRDAAAGLRTATFVSGYEGSPLAGFDLEIMRQEALMDAADVVFRPGLNEEIAATSVQGSQMAQTLPGQTYDGVVGYWFGKAPGLDRATDALRHANLMGTAPTGGAVALVGDDPAAKSSTLPCASEAALADLMIPTLFPADGQDVLDLGVHAVEMSRVSGLWSAMKIVTAVADGAGTVDVAGDRVRPVDPPGARTHRPTGHLLHPVLGPLEQGQVTTRIDLAAEYGRRNGLNRVVVSTPRDRVGIVAAGKTYLDVVAALRRLGLDEDGLQAAGVRLLRLGLVFPIHRETVRDFAAGLDEIVVVEEKRSFVEAAVKDALYGVAGAPAVLGKRDRADAPLFPAHGELDHDTVARLLAPVLAARGIGRAPVAAPRKAVAGTGIRTALPLVARTPSFCSGCPHNTSTKPVSGSLVGAGIGCHAMVLLMEPDRVGEITGVTQMGGEGAQWIGMAPFLDATHFVQNLGDGTFHHSGSLAVRAAVAAGANITYKLLYNSTVAMTGGQDPVGALPVPRIVDLLLAEGVSRIIVTTEDMARYAKVRLPREVPVWDRTRLDEAQQVLAATPGVTVLIHDQECAAEKRRKRKRGTIAAPTTRVVINERICEGCGDCGRKSSCLSVHPVDTEYGRKTRIHQGSCNVDYSCLAGDCPAFMVVEPASGKARRVDVLASDASPDPVARVGVRDFGARMAGIGGTGVVTVSQVLATAASIAGLHVRTMDQTGLAQKGGTVVSDVRISDRPFEAPGKLGAGECDLYLGFDVLAAAGAATLAAASPDRTAAVVSTTRTPTGRMVTDVTAAFPGEEATVGRILEATDAHAAVVLDAREVSERLFGDDQSANMLLIGVAHQAGRLPLPAAAVEAAIELNGVAVERNVQAFRHGRRLVARGGLSRAAEAASAAVAEVRDEAGLDALVARRSAELVDYQSRAYAARYEAVVAEVRAAERAATGGIEVSAAVAANLFKLMAYKDEYEVARLALAHSADQVASAVGPGATYAWKLHPPTLRALGMGRKLTLGTWFTPAFVALRHLKVLRGTPLDPFGRAAVRRVERELVTEYIGLVRQSVRNLDASTRDTVLALAGAPDAVRGYEDVKLANVTAYRARVAGLVDQLGERRDVRVVR